MRSDLKFLVNSALVLVGDFSNKSSSSEGTRCRSRNTAAGNNRRGRVPEQEQGVAARPEPDCLKDGRRLRRIEQKQDKNGRENRANREVRPAPLEARGRAV